MLTLKQFLYSVPICTPPITYEQLRTLFQSSQPGHDQIVVVNAQRIPLGIISSHNFLLGLLHKPLVTSLNQKRENPWWRDSPTSVNSWDWETNMSPLTLISCDLKVSDLANLLSANSELSKQQNYALVDTGGQFLGLLNSWKILQTVLVENPNPQQELASAKHLIKELLEELPLPVMLQTHQGEIIQQNRIWREQIGEFTPPDDATACPLPQPIINRAEQNISLDDNYNYYHNIASLTDIACEHWLKPKNQHWDSSFPSVTNKTKDQSQNFVVHESEKKPSLISQQEKVWQFIKCPLTTDKLPIPISIFCGY